MKLRIAITLGDPRGVGPELVALILKRVPRDVEPVLVGPEELLALYPAERHPAGTLPAARDLDAPGPVECPPEKAGRLAGLAVEEAARLAIAGEVDAIVTAPVEKRSLHLAGYRYPGQTEWLGRLAGAPRVAMMMVAGELRVVLVTTHIPLREVAGALTTERVVAAGRLTRAALEEWWGISEPRIAVCALNPHAGEGGIFGDEDRQILDPAARALAAAGPLPADTVFVRAMKGEFDAVLAPYHDVGMTAIKTAGFGRGVNVTLGLPFVRTAPDHGTAFDIAGRGLADPSSMEEALHLAATLTRRTRGRP